MIKKILLWLFIFIWLSISFSSATCNYDISDYRCDDLSFWQWMSNWNNSAWIISDRYFNFEWNVFTFKANWQDVLKYWWNGNWLWYSVQYNNLKQSWSIRWFFVCSRFPWNWYSFLGWKSSICSYHSWFDDFWYYISGAVNNWISCGYWYYLLWDLRVNCQICLWKSDWSYICMDYSNPSDTSNDTVSNSAINSSAIRNPFVQYDDISFWSNGDIVEISSDLDNSIRFYEDNFNWDINMCYVWTNDLTGAYWKPNVEFVYGSGATIYELYHKIYWTFWNNKIHNVWSFVNVWLLNYATWYKTVSENQLYMATYNWPDQNVSYIYTWFTFPFYNKRLAIYFMADLLSEQYITESSQGENIVYYCDMKLNYDNYKNWTWSFADLQNLVDPKIRNRIQDYVNYAILWQDWYSTPDSSSIWWNLVQSWYSIPNDLNPTNLFQDFYNKINWLVTNFVPVTAVWIVPWWILYPMFFLILFRIMRH